MTRVRLLWRHCFIGLLLLACNCHAWAQNVVFTTGASANKIGLKDQVQITYTLKDAPSAQWAPPTWTDFTVVGGPYPTRSSSISIINGQATQSMSLSVIYVLQPKRTGTLSVPAAVARDGAGHTYQSNPLSIEVVPGSLAPTIASRQRQNSLFDDPFDDPFAASMQRRMQQMQQRQLQQMQQMQQQQRQRQDAAPVASEKDIKDNIFIKVTVDKTKVHVGEQVTTSYKLYSRIPMQVGISKLPSLNGFWTQDFDIPKQPKPTEEVINGKKYQVFLLKKSALFPQQTGTLELDPAEAEGVARIIQQVRQRNPFADMLDDPALRNAFGGSLMMNDPFFNNGFFNTMAYRDVKVHLKSTPVKITVVPTPETGKPNSYNGAVGNFTIDSKLSREAFTTDDVITYTLSINGSGNLKLIEAPKLPLPNGLETFDPQIVDTITGRNPAITGSKIISYAISAHTPGDYDIPSIPFSFYNPQTGKYVTLNTEPFKLHVNAGKHYNPSTTANNALGLKDIHPIVTEPLGEMPLKSKPLLYNPFYWALYVLLLGILITFYVLKKRNDKLSEDTVLMRRKRANKIALKRLATAERLLQEQNESAFYDEVSKAIWLYLSDKLNIPLATLSRESARAALTAKNVPQDLQGDIEDILSECEASLYAAHGGSQQMQYTYKGAIEVISKLEDIF